MKNIFLCFAFLLFLQNLYITSSETKKRYKNKLEDFYLKDGWTPLHFAVYKSNLIIIAEKLIQLGCSPNALNNKGKKPIDLIKDDNMKKMWNNLITKE